MSSAVAPHELQGISESYAEVNGVRLHYAEAGSGPLVLLLHGFPECWYAWHRQLPLLAQAGFHAVAPDMRGYGLSEKPKGWRAYGGEQLSGDIAALIAHFGAERASLVGHDWGAAVAFETAMEHPQVVERLVSINVPHPARLLRAFRTARQLRKSWYMFFFQLPWLPERGLSRNHFAALKQGFRDDAPGVFSEEHLARYAEAWSQPGALSGMINYYRAALRRSPRNALERMRPIECPVLVIWGEHDRYLGAELAEPEPQWVTNARVERLPESTHWSVDDSPERVGELLLQFLR